MRQLGYLQGPVAFRPLLAEGLALSPVIRAQNNYQYILCEKNKRKQYNSVVLSCLIRTDW